jgi:hypothetical protein
MLPINMAAKMGFVRILDHWWVHSKADFKYDPELLDSIVHTEVYEWWKNHGLPMQMTIRGFIRPHSRGDQRLFEWVCQNVQCSSCGDQEQVSVDDLREISMPKK